MNIEELNLKKAKILKSLRKVNDAIEDIELQQTLPALKKQYEGKYFKYQNAYSSESKWWMYVRCVEVKNPQSAVIDYFETRPDGLTARLNHMTFFHNMEVPISKAEWDRELKKFKKAIEKL